MKPRAMFPAVFLVALLALPQLAWAVTVHNLDCKNCHKPALSITALGGGNVCLECHDEVGAVDVTGGTTNSAFLGQDASNALGHNPLYPAAVLRETSHNWSASDNQVMAAGAAPPSRTTYAQFYSRYGSSHGRVTCSRCHNPHATDENPQMLTLGAGSTETMCIACHAPWNKNNAVVNNTFITHPVNVDYPTIVTPYYNTTSPPANDGNINTADGITLYGGKVVCGTCHQVHFADSNPATPDTPNNWDSLSKGDGKILRSYGRVVGDAAKTSTLCKTCHEYSTHEGQHAALGCLDCHSGHSPGGNYNMLRTKVEDVYVPKVSVISNSATLSYTTETAPWKNSGAGYCEGCHDIPLSVAQHNVATAGINECKGCHNHATDSFTSACNACHGYAPETNTPGGSTGYAVSGTYNYSTSGVFKNETTTPHKRHANGSGNYTFNCAQCHYTVTDVNTAPHQNGVFQNVYFSYNSASLALAWTGSSSPSYNPAGASNAGTCSSVYCHSNGGPRGAAPTYAAAPVWAGGAGDITSAGVTNCAACHGNDSATMTARSNSTTHQKHLLKSYTCSACHVNTADSNTTVKSTAIGGEHVNGTKDVLFSDSYDLNGVAAGGVIDLGTGYGDTDGTCSAVYCHSNGAPAEGTVYAIPDWDIATSGACGTCHKYNLDTGVAGFADDDALQDGTATAPLGGSHQAHVFTVGGPKLACTACHTNAGSGNDHVNGALSFVANMQSNVCNPCHGATVGLTTGDDREPIWGDTASVNCQTCHAGSAIAVINTRGGSGSYADQSTFPATGHGDPTLTAAPACTGCHDVTSAGHFDGDGDDRLKADPDGDATSVTYTTQADNWCKQCHDSTNVHIGSGSNCASCHEPHGKGMAALGNTDAMLIKGKSFTDKADYFSYVNPGPDFDGVCQVCHNDSGANPTNYFNKSTYDVTHNPGSACVACHAHGATPAFKASCTGCHGNTAAGNYWPDSTAPNGGNTWPNRLGSHEIHINKIATQNFGATPTMDQKNSTCTWCHPGGGHSGDQAAAPADLMNGTTSKFKNILGVANVQTSTATQASGNVSCSNVDCHYTTATAAADWYTAGSQATCSYCHTVADSPYSAATSNLPDAHDTHMGEFADGGRNLVCTSCHTSASANNAHQDGVINFTTALAPLETTVTMSSAVTAGTVAGPKYGLSAVTTQFSSCASLYCHSNGQTTWTSVAANWASTTVDCTSCHKGAAAGSTLTGAHLAHTLNGATTIGRNLGCQECHSTTVNNNTTISDASKHVQKVRDLLVPNFGTPQAGCATVYCHSNGNTGNLGYNNPAWAASYGCDSCHGDGAGKSYPTYANGGVGANANSHTEHIVGGGYTCNECHAAVSTAGTAINGTTPTKHIDQIVDVNGTKISSYLTGTCNNVSCHGGSSPVWGASLGCRDCHANATTDTDDFSYNNSTFAKVALDEWTYSGHGKPAAANYEITGRAGADLDTKAGAGQDACLYCHDGSVSHGGANLFRLRSNGFTFNSAADLNGTCRACHQTGTTSFNPDGVGGLAAIDVTSVVKIDKFHGGADHAADRDAGRFCWDCHDPHGDADATSQRIQMIQRRAQVNPNDYGVPASLTTTDIVFYNRTLGIGAGAFARDITGAGAAAGVCNNCHTQTNQYTQTTGKGTHPANVCTDCHKHSENTTYDGGAFAGSGCNGCHGGNYDSTDNTLDGTNYWPDDATGTGNAEDYDKGRHQTHMQALAKVVYNHATVDELLDPANGDPSAKQLNLCEYCHDTPGGANHLSGLPAQVNSMKNLWAPYAADNAVYSSNQHGATGNDTCSSVNCHNNKLTTDNTYGWYDASASACIMCHINVPAEQSHSAHLNGNIYGLANTCTYCHDAATNWGTNTKPAANHINGTFNVSGSVTLSYSGTYPTVKGSCGVNACHNNGRNGSPATTPYTWGTTTNSGCNFCHLGNSAGHFQHNAGYNVFYSNAGLMWCTSCHTHSGPSADHLNANINVLGTMNYNGTNLGVTQAANPGTCTTTTCHQDGRGTAKVTPIWNRTPQSSDNCTLCHFNAAPASTFSHDAHIGAAAATQYNTAALNNSTAGEYRFNCAKCHGNTLANHLNTTAANWASAPNVTIDASVNYNAGTDSCVNNACHNNGNGAGAGNDALRTAYWTAINWGAGDDSDDCNNCHGNSPTSNAHQVHAVGIHATDIYSGTTGLLTTATATKAHGDPTTSTTINCNLCHSQTVTMARNMYGSECISCHSGNTANATNIMAVADKTKHTDGTKQVAFAMTSFKSKAQLRNDIATVTELNSSWTRQTTPTSYKAATSYDAAKVTPGPVWGGTATKTCSTVDCHNGIQATWQAPANNCMTCHTSLPQ